MRQFLDNEPVGFLPESLFKLFILQYTYNCREYNESKWN